MSEAKSRDPVDPRSTDKKEVKNEKSIAIPTIAPVVQVQKDNILQIQPILPIQVGITQPLMGVGVQQDKRALQEEKRKLLWGAKVRVCSHFLNFAS